MEVRVVKTCELYQFLISVAILAPIACNGKWVGDSRTAKPFFAKLAIGLEGLNTRTADIFHDILLDYVFKMG